MPMNLGMGLGLGRQQLLGSLPSYTISNGNGVAGVATIVYVGPNWSVNSTGAQGTPGGPWSVTTAQLASGLPILLAAPVITTAAGPIFSVTAGGNDPLFLSPSLDLPEYSYQWFWNTTKLVATGRSYNATGQTGILVEFVCTATNFAGSTVSRFTAQAAMAFTETMIQWSNQKLTNAGTFAANSPLTVVSTFLTPATLVDEFLWQGDAAYNPPQLSFKADGTMTIFLDNAFSTTPAGVLSGSTKYTIFASVDGTRRRYYLKTGSSAPVVLNNANGVLTPYTVTTNVVGQLGAGGVQFTGKMGRLFVAPAFIDFDVSSNWDTFVNSGGTVINPAVGRSLAPTYGIDLCDTVANSNLLVNPGSFGTMTKATGSAFT